MPYTKFSHKLNFGIAPCAVSTCAKKIRNDYKLNKRQQYSYRCVCFVYNTQYTTRCHSFNEPHSSDAGHGIFRLWGSIPCLLMHWLLKSPEHQQTWYFCRVNLMYWDQVKSKILLKIPIYLLQSLKHFSILRVFKQDSYNTYISHDVIPL